MKVLGLIPARGGSKGVPRKNVRHLAGRPLLYYTAVAALGATELTQIVLSTDDDDIAALGRQYGLTVPFLRPAHLATDEAQSIDVVIHALQQIEPTHTVDAVCLLEPTSPFRTSQLIDACVRTFVDSSADTLVTTIPVPDTYHPHRVYFTDSHGRLRPVFSSDSIQLRRQDRPRAVARDGSVFISSKETILSSRSFMGSRIVEYPIDPAHAVNIDTLDDWKRAEALMRASQ